MKRFNYILMSVACLAVMSLVGCIKEEPLTLNTVSMDVMVTRGGETSTQQGDKIEEMMVWAFQKTSNSSVENKAAGWRRETYTGDNYTTASLHLDLPMCGDAGADYILIAVVNPAKFGAVTYGDKALTLGPATTYTELINARFANSAAATPILGSVAEGKPGDPALMPVSHWTTISVTKSDLHKSSGHKVVLMSVFRAVAKTQFLVARSSAFDLKIKSLELHNAKMPVDGLLLSQLSKPQLESVNVNPSWFGDNVPSVATLDSQKSHAFQLPAAGVEVTKELISHSDDASQYTLVGACTIAETLDACTYVDNATSVPSDAADGGYYYKITYQVGAGVEQTRYVALPAVARNHDYQVRAIINGEGGLNVTYAVADWQDVEWVLDFSPANNTNMLVSPDVNKSATTRPTVTYNANMANAVPFKGYFRMSGPIGVEWQPVFYDAESDKYTIEVYEVKDPLTVTLATVKETMPVVVTEANKDKFYEVRVIANDPSRNGQCFKLAISHTSPWHPDAKLLLINAGESSTTTYWPESGNHHTYIEILQN